MIKRFYFAGLVVLLVNLFTPSVFAQDSEPALASDAEVEEAAPAEPEIPASQEVEINEDNYRQFMELRDANRQRDIIPEDVFKPDTGLQKLQKLPEDSQKHLRNQLREVISQGDEWQPGDEETEYPYTPSEAASTDPSLAKQELEAWGELVDGYNQREAQIYENSSGTRSAMGTENGTSENPGNSAGSPNGGGQSGEGSQGQQNGQENNPDQNDSAGTYSPNASNDSNSDNTAGVSQNAKEFLQGLGKAGGNAGDGDSETPAENGGQGESPTPSETGSQTQIGQQDSSGQDSTAASQTGQGQGETQTDEQNVAQADGQDTAQADVQADGQAQDGQQTETAEKSVSTPPPASTSPISTVDAEEESTAGASQNALDYLTGGSVQTDDGVKDEPDTTQQEGTLTIQDLLNAQGTGNSTGTVPASTSPNEIQKPDEAKPDKDGGG